MSKVTRHSRRHSSPQGPLNWFGKMLAAAFILSLLLAGALVIVLQAAMATDALAR